MSRQLITSRHDLMVVLFLYALVLFDFSYPLHQVHVLRNDDEFEDFFFNASFISKGNGREMDGSAFGSKAKQSKAKHIGRASRLLFSRKRKKKEELRMQTIESSGGIA